MGTTTNHALPYPEPADRARNGSVAVRALAEAADARLPHIATTAIQINEADSASTADGNPIAFPGTAALLAGFTWDGATLTYQPADGLARSFVAAFAVEVDVSGADVTEMSSYLGLQFNGTTIATSYDRVVSAAPGGTLDRRIVVHRITTPVAMGTGDTLRCVATSTPAGAAIGVCSIRVYPIGPR